MHVKYNYLAEQFSDSVFEKVLPEIRELIASGEFTLGPYVDKFEKKFAKYVGVKHVISTNNGTDALILCLKAVGVKPGDEVITVANTFYATAGAIVACGATPRFVDCNERYSMDPTKIETALTSKTTAILPVHWAGQPADMKEIMAIADRHRIAVVEDACPSVGASIDGKSVGTFGKVNAFSMHPLKPLNVCGDGGMVTTNDDKCAEWLRLYRNHGMVDRDHIDIWGVNNRLQPFQAVMGCHVLDTMPQIIKVRNANARRFDEGLADLPDFVRLCPRPKGMLEVYQLYLCTVKKRDDLVKYLNEKGIEAKVHYPVALHLQKAAKNLGYKKGDFPVAEQQADEIVTLPSHQHLTLDQIDYTIDCVHKFYKQFN